jgi:UDP-N-acetylglucosamine transferase subunit ALG13
MPRRRQFGEHLDDHQLQIARILAEQGLITVVEATDQLAPAVAKALSSQPAKTNFNNQPLRQLITDFIDGN